MKVSAGGWGACEAKLQEKNQVLGIETPTLIYFKEISCDANRFSVRDSCIALRLQCLWSPYLP